MNVISLTELGEELLVKATSSRSGRSAQTIYGGRDQHLRQTLVAIRGGEGLAEHTSPGEVTVYVLEGAVDVRTSEKHSKMMVGEIGVIPNSPHSVHAFVDSVILITVAVKLTK